jgi:ribonucleoside-diphosphate reductase beta chain
MSEDNAKKNTEPFVVLTHSERQIEDLTMFPGERITTVLNLNPNVDWRKQPMFFGEKLGIARFDKLKYPIFEKLTKRQKSNFWSEEDINLQQDRIDYVSKLQPNQKRIFDKNIAYQTVMDSVAARAILEAFSPWISLPELEECVKTWVFFETIHNRAYQWIEQNLHTDPSVHFDTILKDTSIVKRAQSIVTYYDDFIRYSNRVKVFGYTEGHTSYAHKTLAYKAMVSVYALESIRFYVSFACTFALGQQELMVGNAKEVKLIARDEALHVGISMNIIRLWPKEDEDFKKIIEENREFVHDLFREVIDQEKEWAAYLFEEGPMLGLNTDLMGKYLEHLGNKRLKGIGHDQIFENKINPFNWMSNWIASDEEQVAPQETEIVDYKVSALSTSVKEEDLDTDF